MIDWKSLPEKQWRWMMNWCKKQGIPPAQKWAWSMAMKAWKDRKDEK